MKVINLSVEIARTISSRDIIQKMKRHQKLSQAKVVSFDFKNVDFISRSATHELLRLRDTCPETKFRYINRSRSVTKMFKIVESKHEAHDEMDSKKTHKSYFRRISLNMLPKMAF